MRLFNSQVYLHSEYEKTRQKLSDAFLSTSFRGVLVCALINDGFWNVQLIDAFSCFPYDAYGFHVNYPPPKGGWLVTDP